MKALRVEMIVPAMVPAGMEMVVARLTRRLAARGHDVAITCIEYLGDLGERLRREGVPVEVAYSPGLRTIVYPAALVRRLRDRRPDVVHVHSGAWIKGARAAAFARVPRVIHTEHGLLDHEPSYAPLIKQWAARYTAAVAAVSAPLLTYLREVDGLPPAKLRVVPNGIDTDVFQPDGRPGNLRTRFGIGAERFVIGHVARLSPVKNHRLLLDAFALLHEARPEAFLALIGDGDLRPQIETRISELGLADHVGLYGVAHDLPPLYRELDVFVLSSLAEGTSMSILEAMSSALPVVATDVGGNADLLGETGVLVPSGDPAALATAIGRVIADPAGRRAMGCAARRRIVHEYDEELVTDRYEALYRNEAAAPSVPALAAQTCAE